MKKISSPSIIKAVGNKPKVIEEYVGRVNSGTNSISIAKMSSPTAVSYTHLTLPTILLV